MIDNKYKQVEGCIELIGIAQEIINTIPDADESFLEPVKDLITKMAKAIKETAIDASGECIHCHGEIPYGHSLDCIAYDCETHLNKKPYSNKKECKCVKKIMIQELNTFPYGETIEFKKCVDCGKRS